MVWVGNNSAARSHQFIRAPVRCVGADLTWAWGVCVPYVLGRINTVPEGRPQVLKEMEKAVAVDLWTI